MKVMKPFLPWGFEPPKLHRSEQRVLHWLSWDRFPSELLLRPFSINLRFRIFWKKLVKSLRGSSSFAQKDHCARVRSFAQAIFVVKTVRRNAPSPSNWSCKSMVVKFNFERIETILHRLQINISLNLDYHCGIAVRD